MKEVNFSLLTQKEIDVLVNFLLENQRNVDSEVLSQESIDKLIILIKNSQIDRLRLDLNQLLPIHTDKLKELELLDNEKQTCELLMEEEGEFIQLYAIRPDNGKKYKITPEGFRVRNFTDDISSWGRCLQPIIFDEIATAFQLKYTQETYCNVCRKFAKENFGDEAFEIPKAFLVDDMGLIKNLI